MEKIKKVSSWLLLICFCAFLAVLLIPVDRPEPEPQTDAEWLLDYLHEKEAAGEEVPPLTYDELQAILNGTSQQEDAGDDDDFMTEAELREVLGDDFFDTMPEAEQEIAPQPDINPFPSINPAPIIDTSIDCMICGGDGRKPCTFCGGTGSTSSTNYGPNFGFGSSSYETSKSCITCGGSREVFCTDCGGDGKIG